MSMYFCSVFFEIVYQSKIDKLDKVRAKALV